MATKSKYKDLSYRDFLIPKKNGKPRRISAPSKELLQYQHNLMKGLYAYHAKQESALNCKNIQHGFIPNRNCVTAATQHIGYKHTIIMDLSNFFDSVNTSFFPKTITRYSHLFHKEGHCAQGFASSPIMANIASLPMIKYIKQSLNELHKAFIISQDNLEPEDDSESFAFTVYADDIQISTNCRPLIKHIINSVTHIAESHKFSINRNKTRVRNKINGYRRILGINVGSDHIRATRKTMRKIRAADHQGNFHSKGGLTTWSHNLLPKVLRARSI